MAIFNIEIFMQQALENATPQTHRSRWSEEEDKLIADCIQRGLSLPDIHRIISLRSLGAIRTRANSLGYGNRKNKNYGETYFSREINHKNRRTKDEILAEKESVPIPIELNDSMEKDIEVAVDIIPKKQIIVYVKDMFNKSLPTNVFDCIFLSQ